MNEVILHLQTRDGGRSISLAGGWLSIGGGKEADLQLDDDGLAGRQATIYREGERVWLVNEAANGRSLINQCAVPSAGAPLADGDEIRLGHHTRLWVSLNRAAEPRSVQPLVAATILMAAVLAGIGTYAVFTLADRRESEGNQITAIPTHKATPGHPPAPSPTSLPAVIPALPPVARKLYQNMTSDQEKLKFINNRVQQISLRMSSSGRPYDIPAESLGHIKYYLDGYVRRLNVPSKAVEVREDCVNAQAAANSLRGLWGDNLHTLYRRASCYAPLIIRAFKDEGVPEEVGLYIVMIETEYHHICKENKASAMGMFQFIPGTAKAYGVPPEERCDARRMTPVAARYMRERIGHFGTDQWSVPLAIAGYNRSPASVERDLKTVTGSAGPERSFWNLVANKVLLDKWFNGENVRYVPKFFAAAIIGEYPEEFGLGIKPLSSYHGGLIPG